MSILDKALVRAVIRELDGEQDEREALLTALLALILTVQDDLSEDKAPLLDYLVLQFPPVHQSFVEQRRPFIRGEQLTLSRSGQHVRLRLRDEFMRQLVGETE